jgi:hypothetical protein
MKLPAYSMNDKLILEPYDHGQGLKTEIRNGLAFVQQKVNLVPLRVLVEARLNDGSYIPSGAIVYLEEDALCGKTATWAKVVRKCKALKDQQFIIVDKQHIIMVDTGEDIQ